MIALLNNKFFVIFLAPFILGVLTIFGFPPYNFTFVNFFTFSILLFFIFLIKKRTFSTYRKKKSNRYFFYLGISFGFGFFLFGNYWISISLTHDENFKKLIPFALVIIPLFLSIFFGLAILIVGNFIEKKIYFIFLFSLIFSIFEFLRGNLLTGFPWNLISYTWSWSIEFIQILSLIGTYGLSLISITIFCTPFIFFKNLNNKNNIIFLIFLSFLLIFIYLYGSYKINNTNYTFDKNISVKIISPNFSLQDYNNNSEIKQLKRLIKISNPQKNNKTLFIWPEGIFYESYLQNIDKYKNLFKENFSENHLVVFGVNNLYEDNIFNSLVVVNHKLEILSLYNKINLVPFGEFLPFEDILNNFGFKKITEGHGSFLAGQERKNILIDNLNILPLICYEIIFPNLIKNSNENTNLIVNISEDGWFGQSIGPDQHFAKSIFRAIENNTFLLRSANRGVSAIIDNKGKIIKKLNRNEAGNIEFEVPLIKSNKIKNDLIFFILLITYLLIFLIYKKNDG